MSLVRLSGVVLCLALVGFAPAPFPRKERSRPRDDLQAMQGLWRMTAQENNGRTSTHDFKARVKGDRWTFIPIQAGRESNGPGYFLALDQKVSPPALVWKSSKDATSGWVGSYRLRGRTLTIIYDRGTLKEIDRRPKDFAKAPHKMVFEFVGR